MEALFSSSTLTLQGVSFSLSGFLSFSFVNFHSSLHLLLLLSSFSLYFSYSPAYPCFFHSSLPIWYCACHSFLISYSSSPISHSMSLSLPVFMSFWPRSHFPNWLSGSLIILRHPCCRLFYLSACRRPNPLISKYPFWVHIALQQPTAFLVYFSIVHTSSQHWIKLKETKLKGPLEDMSCTWKTKIFPLFSSPLWLNNISLMVKYQQRLLTGMSQVTTARQ